jgi:hypothetical protein
VGDPVVDADNDHGLVGLHWAALKRFWGAVRRIEGWTPGEVAFGEGYRPIPVSQLDLHAFEHKPPVATIAEADLASSTTSVEVA